MRIFKIGFQGYYFGVFEDIPDQSPIPAGWTKTAPPSDEELGGYHARMGPDRKWHITHIKPETFNAQPVSTE